MVMNIPESGLKTRSMASELEFYQTLDYNLKTIFCETKNMEKCYKLESAL